MGGGKGEDEADRVEEVEGKEGERSYDAVFMKRSCVFPAVISVTGTNMFIVLLCPTGGSDPATFSEVLCSVSSSQG